LKALGQHQSNRICDSSLRDRLLAAFEFLADSRQRKFRVITPEEHFTIKDHMGLAGPKLDATNKLLQICGLKILPAANAVQDPDQETLSRGGRDPMDATVGGGLVRAPLQRHGDVVGVEFTPLAV
jgi:hypothetical protein